MIDLRRSTLPFLPPTRGILAVLVMFVLIGGVFAGGGEAPGTPGTDGSRTAVSTATPASTVGSDGPTTAADGGATGPVPGVTADGVTDLRALLEAHRTGLVAAGYRSVLRIETAPASATEGGTVFEETTAVAAGLSAYRSELYRASPEAVLWRRGLWSNGTTTLTRSKLRTNRWRFTRGGPDAVAPRLTRAELLGRYLAAGNYTLAETEPGEAGPIAVLRATGYRRPDESFPAPSAVASFTASVRIDEAGRIRRLNATVRTGGRVVTVTYEVTALGDVAVERPDWIRKAVVVLTAGDDPAPY